MIKSILKKLSNMIILNLLDNLYNILINDINKLKNQDPCLFF